MELNKLFHFFSWIYREMEEVGETIRPFLDIDQSTTCTSCTTSENSTGEENDSENNYKNQSQKQVCI